jgi:hypothetical protein
MDDVEQVRSDQTVRKKRQRVVLYDELMLFIALAISCIAVVVSNELTEHPSMNFGLLGITGLAFHIFAYYGYTSKEPRLNPYGAFLFTIWFWLLWNSTKCLRGDYELRTEKVFLKILSEADVWVFVACLFSETITVFASNQGSLVLFAINWSVFFSVPPPENSNLEMLKIQLFLVYITRYLVIHHVKRFFLPNYKELMTDYTTALSGFWILMSGNFLVVVSGILVCVVCQAVTLTISEFTEKKIN